MIANALLYYLMVINIVTFLVYGIDKIKAKQGSWRISEATLLIFADRWQHWCIAGYASLASQDDA